MRKRTTKKTTQKKTRKPAKTAKRKAVKKKSAAKKAMTSNKMAHWDTYKAMQKKVDLAWDKLRCDAKRKSNPRTLIKDKNHLLLLLGECNYMARECMRMSHKRHRR